jgi:hypothetical protein
VVININALIHLSVGCLASLFLQLLLRLLLPLMSLVKVDGNPVLQRILEQLKEKQEWPRQHKQQDLRVSVRFQDLINGLIQLLWSIA